MTPRAKMEQVLSEFTLEFEKAASLVLHETVLLHCGPNEKLRLINLKVWSLRHKVSLEFIIKELLTFWLPKFGNKGKRKKGTLGVRIATLCGKRSREFIAERIEELFPNNENIVAWKAEQQMANTPNVVGFISSNPLKMAREYSAVLKTARADLDHNRDRLSKRPFRDNPFR